MRTTMLVSCAGLVLILASGGCVAAYKKATRIGTVDLSDQRIFPKSPKFTVQPGDGTNTALDFNAVYFRDLRGKRSATQLYYRFWPNGRVIRRTGYGMLIQDEVERFEYGDLGYYQIEGGRIRMEFFLRANRGKDVRYSEFAANVQGEGLDVYEPYYDEGLKFAGFYNKRIYGELTRQPDW